MATAITSAGTFGGGDYYLANDISSSVTATSAYVGALTFTGPFTLSLNGKKLTLTGGAGTSSAPVLSVGVLSDYQGKITGAGGKIEGARVGAKLGGAASEIYGVDLSDNLYAGAWLLGANSKFKFNVVARVGGVSDQAYATGIQINADNVEVAYNTFIDLYRQSGYAGGGAGEGVGVNLTSGTSGGNVHHNRFVNNKVALNTYAVFGGGSNSKINDNFCRNFWRGFAIATLGSPEAKRNLGILETMLANSRGLGCEGCRPEAVAQNVMIGFSMAYTNVKSPTPTDYNVALTFPGLPEPTSRQLR
jgi:hypothetical protein